MAGEPVSRDHLLLVGGGKILLVRADPGFLLLASSSVSSQTSTNQLTKPVDFRFVEDDA